MITIDQLSEALREVKRAHPTAVLLRNQVGNIAIMSYPEEEFLGYIDLGTGAVEWFKQ